MKRISYLILILVISTSYLNIFAQDATYGANLKNITINSANLIDRGSGFYNSSFIKGSINISDFAGNLTIGHSMSLNYPNDLKTKLTLMYNANACHAYFEDSYSRYWNDHFGIRENNVNAPDWIFAINGIAIQTTDFEKNVFITDRHDSTDIITRGTEVPLLCTGYNYCNNMEWPVYSDPNQLPKLGQSDYFPLKYDLGAQIYDNIRILNAQGSVITLSNPEFMWGKGDVPPYSAPGGFQLTGTYFDLSNNSNAYAIVTWKDSVYGERNIYYHPGDGLTYYFEEEFTNYEGYTSRSQWNKRGALRPKIAYLKEIRSPNGDKLVFDYDDSGFGSTISNGRKFFKSLTYYNSAGVATGPKLTFSYIKSGNVYEIQINNSVSGESYTIDLNNYNPSNNLDFNSIDRSPSDTTSNIMMVSKIINNNNTSKYAQFIYGSYSFRKYTYDEWQNPPNKPEPNTDPDFLQIGYYVKYPIRLLTSRIINRGGKNNFSYWTNTELNGITTFGSSYNDIGTYTISGTLHYGNPEHDLSMGYYINAYTLNPSTGWMNSGGSFITDIREFSSSYNFNNMNYAARDNYAETMIKSESDSLYNDSTSSYLGILKKDYKYSWDGTLDTVDNSGNFIKVYNHSYDVNSPLIDNILTQIITTNISNEKWSADSVYTEKKYFQFIKNASKKYYRGHQIDPLNPREIRQEVVPDTRIKKDVWMDENNNEIRETDYEYYNGTPGGRWTYYIFTGNFYFNLINPYDFNLKSKTIFFDGVEKAKQNFTYSFKPDFDFSYITAPYETTTMGVDTVKIRYPLAIGKIESETYKTANNQSMLDSTEFNNTFTPTLTQIVSDSNFIYEPSLTADHYIFGKIGSGTWVRKSRINYQYYPLSDLVGKRTNLEYKITMGKTDNYPDTTKYTYYTSGSLKGYLESTFNGKLTTTYNYNSQNDYAHGIIVKWGGDTMSYAQQHNSFQPEPFKTTKTFSSQYGNVNNYVSYTAYDGKGNLIFSSNKNGYYTSNYYDPLGRIVKEYKPFNYSETETGLYEPDYANASYYGSVGYTYNDNLWTPQITKYSYGNNFGGDPVETKSYFVPSELAYVNSVIDGNEVLKSKEKYNYLGEKISTEDGDGRQTFHLYDRNMNLYETRFVSNTPSADNKKQTIDYSNNDTYFKRSKITDENGNYEYNYYDLFGNLIKNVKYLSSSKSLSTFFNYNSLNQLTTVTTPEGKITKYNYDDKGNISYRKTPDAGTTKYIYDKYGNLRFVQDADHQSSSINNVDITKVAPSGTMSGNFTLAGKGNVTFTLNNAGYTINSGSIILKICTMSGVVIDSLIANSSNSFPTSSFVLPKGEYHYIIQITSKDQYGTRPLVTNFIRCKKNLDFVYNKYDALNRLIETGEYETNDTSTFSQANANNANFPPEASCMIDKEYFYDSASSDANAAGQRNLKGKLSYIEKFTYGYPGYASFYSYDDLGRVEWLVEEHLGWYVKKLEYHYDMQGRITQKDLIDKDWRNNDFHTAYTYDATGRLSTVETKHDPESYHQDAVYTYYPSDKVKQLEIGSGQNIAYTYNNRGWISKITSPVFWEHLGYDNQSEIASGAGFNFQPQKNGNISWITYYMEGETHPISGPVGWVYHYDNLNRLVNADFGENEAFGVYQQTNDYDVNKLVYSNDGNLDSLQRNNENGSLADNLKYNYLPNTNKLSSLSGSLTANYTYDDNGNVVSDSREGIAFIIYNLDNLPVRIYKTNGEEEFYTYDNNGNRVRKYFDGGGYAFYFRGISGKSEAVCQAPNSSNLTYNIWGPRGDNIGQVRVNNNNVTGRYYYLKDHLGNIKMTIDGSGNVISYSDYYPFGSIMCNRSKIASDDERYKFTGKERDSETGYDYFGARYYDSFIGRWLQVDPLANKYPGWSSYNYTLDNPINLIDPNGAYSYYIDGVPIDNSLGSEMMHEYQQYQFLQGDKNKKQQKQRNGDSNKDSKTKEKEKKHLRISISLYAAFSDAAGEHAAIGYVYDWTAGQLYVFDNYGGYIGYAYDAGANLTFSYELAKDFFGTNTSSWSNNKNNLTVDIGQFNFIMGKNSPIPVGVGGSVSAGKSLGVELSNKAKFIKITWTDFFKAIILQKSPW